MKNKESEVLLTPSLYLEISTDKSNEIASLKQKKIDALNELKKQALELKKLEEAKENILKQISVTEENISNLKKNKFKLVVELGKQKRIAKKLNKKILKDDSYIRVSDYYTEGESKKR